MARIKKLSRSQIKSLRKQVRDNREKAIEELHENDPDLAREKIEELNKRRDKTGLTRDERENASSLLREINKQTPTISWKFDEGSLVQLPNGDIGIIVKNEAKEVKLGGYEYDMKKAMKKSKYYGQVYVVTSNGNQWYYPKQLKIIREN